MKKIVAFFLTCFFRIALWFRYRITYKGLKNINSKTMDQPGGVLFLPNHPAVFVDPIIVGLGAYKVYPVRPMVVEYMYYLPFVNGLLKYMDALPVPNFSVTSNSIKKRRMEKVFDEVIEGIKKGENFLIYPAGSTKNQGKEVLGGASGLHNILSEIPNANIVLVRVKGLWGSKFSRAFIGKAPPLFPTLTWGIKEVFKNLLFFTPRRKVVVEFVPAPADFPRGKSRLEVNRYLENWYNQPDNLTKQEGEHPGDSLMLVPYSAWTREKPVINREEAAEDQIDLSDIPDDIRRKVILKLSELTEMPPEKIKEDQSISTELGLDSLDTAEILSFLHDEFEVSMVPVTEITTVGKVLALASKKIVIKEEVEEFTFDLSEWKKKIPRVRSKLADGKTLPEAFLNAAEKYKKQLITADDRLAPMDYETLKLRAIVLALYIQKLPGKNIGVLLPASVGALLAILACELAGKVPVMINWTVGPRHLETVKELSDIQTVLSSWAFIDRLEGIEFNGLEDRMLMLEDIRREIGLSTKLKGKLISRKKPQDILKALNIHNIHEDDPAVLLFTSGSESQPKGVPLSHKNIISNLGPIFKDVPLYSDDILLGILPPFHSFGFSISTFLPVLSGIKVAFYPKPTDGLKLAERVERWGATIIMGAPTFLKSILKSAKPEQVKTMRLCITGAEKAPPELFKMVENFGNGEVIEGYGITECSPVLTMNRPDVPKKGVGLPLDGVQLKIVHPETNKPVQRNEQGMILARGPGIFKGYLNPGIEPPFVEVEGLNWYRTGDLGSIDENGYLTISGRLKRFVKIGGEMVSLSAVEEGLLKMGVSKGWPIGEEGASLALIAKEVEGEKARLILYTNFSIELDEINKSVREAGFSNLVRISQVNQMKEIPLMGTGKVNYRMLENMTG